MDYERIVKLNDEDPDLVEITVDILDIIQRTYRHYGMPAPDDFPPLESIDNYGLPRNEQVFKYAVYPPRLQQIEDGIRSEIKKSLKSVSPLKRDSEVIERFWEYLTDRQDEYEEELKWIEKQWYHRLFGYWFICDGEATWMPGKCYFYLNFFNINNVGKPQYRNRDRKWWIGMVYSRLETRTFKFVDKDGFAIPNTDGSYDMIDTGRRVFYGHIGAKPRRVGDTSKSGCNVIEEGTRVAEVHLGIQGADEKGGANVFMNHVTIPFKKIPIIFKPQLTRINLKEPLRFDSMEIENPLTTVIDYADSKYGSAYDGRTLHEYYGDEVGKVEEESIKMRHKVVRLCCSERDIIRGAITYTTTVEDMSKSGAKEFLDLCKDSMWDKRLPNGQTPSGMLTLFFRASDGHPDFIDRFGKSIEDTPTEEQAAYIGKKFGAIEHLTQQRRILRDEDLAKEKRQNPLRFREVFTPPSKNIFFPIRKIEERLSELNFSKGKYVRRGDFYWKDGMDSSVMWKDNPENGHFFLSRTFSPEENNRVVINDEKRFPEFPDRIVMSVDSFQLDKTDSGRMSDGGIAAYEKRNIMIDPDDRPMDEWQTSRFILTYRHRPETTDRFFEDCIMAAVYLGAKVFPENNLDNCQRYFIQRGYEGYLLYNFDPFTGRRKNNCGFSSRGASKPKIFNLLKDDLERHVKRYRHADLLKEVLDIAGLEDMTNQDLFTAAGGCLLAIESQQAGEVEEQKKFDYRVDGWLQEYQY